MTVNTTVSDTSPLLLTRITDHEKLPASSIVPSDRYHIAYFIMVLMGIGSLLPGFVYLLSLDFYFSVFPDFREISYIFNFGFNAGQVVALLVLLLLESRTSLQFRLIFFYTINFVGLSASAVVNYFASTESFLDQHSWKHKAASWTVVCISSVLGISCGVVIGACFSLAGRFPSRYFSAVMTGISAAGIVTASLRIGSKGIQDATGNRSLQAQMISTNVYFGLATLIQVACVIGTFFLMKLPITQFVTRDTETVQEISDDPQLESDKYMDWQSRMSRSLSEWFITIKNLIFPGLGAFFTFTVTLSIYPGLIVDIRSQDSHFQASQWSTVLMLACYALCDFLGRSLAGLKQFHFVQNTSGRVISWVLVVSRALILYPVFFLLIRFALHVIDPVKFVACGLLGFSGGYLGSICMMQGGYMAKEGEQKKSGMIMTFWLNVGCFTGALLALLLGYLSTFIRVT
jgi:equilibrative nucleoside transporter 1/2/3